MCTPVLRKSLCALGSYDPETQQLVKPNLQQRNLKDSVALFPGPVFLVLFFVFLDFTENEITDWKFGMPKRFDIHKGYVNGFLYM